MDNGAPVLGLCARPRRRSIVVSCLRRTGTTFRYVCDPRQAAFVKMVADKAIGGIAANIAKMIIFIIGRFLSSGWSRSPEDSREGESPDWPRAHAPITAPNGQVYLF
jgi:hypothetical protein